MHEKRWPFAATLRLAAGALLLAMLAFLADGLAGSLLTTAAGVFALLALMEFVRAWRWQAASRRGGEPQQMH